MTESDPTAAAQPATEDDAKKAEAERPAHRKSVFWDHADRIRELLADGRSYRQILCIIHLKNMHRSVLARWCKRQGLHSQCPGRPGSRTSADKKSAPSTVPTAPPAPASPGPGAAIPSLADAYGPEPGDLVSDLLKGTQQ